MEERRLDLRIPDEARSKEGHRTTKLVFQLNQTEPYTEEYDVLVHELFTGGFGEESRVNTPLFVNLAANVHIGKNVLVRMLYSCRISVVCLPETFGLMTMCASL